jgi:hypothetical protein
MKEQLRKIVREIMREQCISEINEESVNEAASKEAMGIAALTGTRGSAVEEFINKHELDGGKLFRSIKKANLRGRLNFVSALAGKDGNPNQKLTIKLHKKNESVVNERYSDFIKAKNLTDIVALSKKKKNATFYVTDDNNSRIGTFYLKNGKFAKATTANANYDLQNSKTKLKDRSDVIYKYKIDESVVNEMAMGFDTMTGLFYLKGVPFTKERIKEVILFMKSSKPKTSSNQFEMTSALIIKDKVNKGEVTIDSKNLKTLIEAFKKYKNLASDKDFN